MQSVKPDYGEKTKFKSQGNLLILRSKFSGNQVPEFLIFSRRGYGEKPSSNRKVTYLYTFLILSSSKFTFFASFLFAVICGCLDCFSFSVSLKAFPSLFIYFSFIYYHYQWCLYHFVILLPVTVCYCILQSEMKTKT